VSQQRQPPRPFGPHRAGSGTQVKPPLVRSESPAPEAKRPAELAAQPILAVDAGWSDDAAAVRSAEEREEALRAERAKTARLTVELDRERKSREPPLPSPKAARQREQTSHDWPPVNGGYLPGMPESTPPMRGKLESHQHLHVILEREARARDDSMPPRSARQRAGDAIKGARQPLLVTLISTLLSGGSITAYLTASKGQGPPPDATAAAGYALLKNELERQGSEQRRQAEQQAQFQGWVIGYMRATGARVEAVPGAPAPTVVEIRALPAPRASVAPVLAAPKRGGAPQPARVDVLTPPPPSLPPPKAPDLPERIGP
jgi:hypothetical protein